MFLKDKGENKYNNVAKQGSDKPCFIFSHGLFPTRAETAANWHINFKLGKQQTKAQ